MSFAGTYFDGGDLHGRAVEISLLEDRSLLLCAENLAVAIPAGQWVFSRPLARIPRFAAMSAERSLEVPWSAAAEEELGRLEPAPSRTRALVGALESRAAIVGAAVALLVAAIAAGLYVVLPHMARQIAFAVPPSIEVKIGRASEAALAQFVGRSTLDPYERRKAERQLERLVRARAMHVHPYLVFCAMGQPNAFALPGGPIVVTDELLRMDLTDDEIAGVLAHELGHEELRHGLQNILSSSSALIVVSIITGDLSTLTHFSGTLPSLLLTRGYSRDFERQADAYAVSLLAAASIDPESLAHALEKIGRAGPPDATSVTYLSTHPSTPERIHRIQTLAAKAWKAPPAPMAARIEPATRPLPRPAGSVTAIFNAAMRGVPESELPSPPSDAKLFDDLGKQKIDEGDEKGAAAAVARAIAADRNYASAYDTRGFLKRRHNDLDGAIADFDHALALDPRNASAYDDRGVAEAMKKDLSAAIADFNRALAIDPDDAQIHANLGWGMVEADRMGEAVAELDRAIELNPRMTLSYDIRGWAEICMGATGPAITDFDHAIALRPDDGTAYGNRGVAEQINGDYPGAKADYEKYCRLDPGEADGARLRLALIARREHPGAGPAEFPAEALSGSDEWTKTLGRFVNGATDEAELLKNASQGDASAVTKHRCIAYYYLGMMHLLKGEKNQALNFFNKCAASGVVNLDEPSLARGEISRFQWNQGPIPRRN